MGSDGTYKKEELRYMPCLLKRLTDLEPQIQKEPFSNATSLKQIKKDIFENIEMLLNSRSHPQPEALERYPEMETSVLAYGLRDFCGKSCSQFEKEEIQKHILQQVRWFEPRLDPQSVQVSLIECDGITESVVTLQISGYIQVGQVSEEIVFLSKLDFETGNATIQNIHS